MKEKLITIDGRIDWPNYVPKHNIAYLEFGDSNNPNVIVCAHGLTRNSRDFAKLAKALSDNFRVICLDYPGRGRSAAFEEKEHYNYQVYVKDSITFLKKLGIKNCTWLGTSMGGIIGMVLASKYKKLIKNLIINDIGPFIKSEPLVKIGQYASSSPTFINLEKAKEYLKKIYGSFGIKNEEDWDHLTKYSFIETLDGKYKMNYDPAIVYGMTANNKKPKDVDIWSIWYKITCKLLIIHGAKSEILEQSTIDKMKETKDFDLYVVDYAGHAPSLMEQDQINYIKNWLKVNILN